MNDKKILDSKQQTIDNLEEKLGESQLQNRELAQSNMDLSYFSLQNNEQAITYFEAQGIDPETLENTIKDAIISRNKANEDNELVPFAGMNGIMRINKLKILNHKWILADFTDGTYWGELFITYEIDEDKNLQLNTEKSFLYPVN